MRGGFLRRPNGTTPSDQVVEFVGAILIMADSGEPPPDFFWLPEPIYIDVEADVSALIEAIGNAGGADLIIIDTLARCLSGDENSASEIGKAIAEMDRLRQSFDDATILCVHHTGKDESRGARGSSALRAAVDTELAISRVEDGPITLSVTKARDGETGDRMAFDLETVELGFDEDGDPVTSARLSLSGEVPERPVSFSPNEQTFLAALDEYSAETGEPNPEGPGFPEAGSVRVVDRDAFMIFARQQFMHEKADSRRRAAERAQANLHRMGQIIIRDQYLWRAVPHSTASFL